MGSLPYVPHPHDDTKGGARPSCGIPRIDEESSLFLLRTIFLDIHR